MNIRVLDSQYAEIYRNIRLEALRNYPEAFGSSFEEESQWPLDNFKIRLTDNHSFTFGFFDNEQLDGVVTLVFEKRIKLKHRANIFAMYVRPEKCGSGIARKLMTMAIEKAREVEAIEQIYLAVVSTNEAAKKLYRSLGFEIYGKEKKALLVNNVYYDEDLMVLFV